MSEDVRQRHEECGGESVRFSLGLWPARHLFLAVQDEVSEFVGSVETPAFRSLFDRIQCMNSKALCLACTLLGRGRFTELCAHLGVNALSQPPLMLRCRVLVDQLGPLRGLAGADHEVLQLGAGVGGEGVAGVAEVVETEVLRHAAEAVELLATMLAHLGAGRAVSVVPSDAELTTQQAADVLNVSRPFLIGLLEAGEIEYRTVGTHRRITASSLLQYKRKDDQRRREAADELTQLGQEMGMI